MRPLTHSECPTANGKWTAWRRAGSSAHCEVERVLTVAPYLAMLAAIGILV
jgi:hypothetical protein